MNDWLIEYEKFRSTPWAPTTLPAKEEKQFRQWMTNTQLFKSIKPYLAQDAGVSVDKLNDAQALDMLLQTPDYDYRGAWKSGVKEVISPYDGRPHWPSATPEGRMLKDPSHPTAWKEFFMRQYNVDPDELGLDTFAKARAYQQQPSPLEPAFMYKDPFGAPD